MLRPQAVVARVVALFLYKRQPRARRGRSTRRQRRAGGPCCSAVAESGFVSPAASPPEEPEEKTAPSPLPGPRWDAPEARTPDRAPADSQEPERSRRLEAADPSQLRGGPRPGEDWPTEEELRRFWTLRQEIVEKEQAEVLEKQLLAVELPPNLRAMLRGREEARPGPGPRHTLRWGPEARGAPRPPPGGKPLGN